MKQVIRDYLTFNKRERNGVFILLSIITLQLIYLNVSGKFEKNEQADFSVFEKQMDSIQLVIKTATDSLKLASANNYGNYSSGNYEKRDAGTKENRTSERFNFDPNNLPD